MKKFKLLLLAIVGIFALTGCGGKTLTCTMSESESGMEMKGKIVATFKKDKVSKVKMTMDAKATDDSVKKNWSLFANTLKSQYSEKKADGVKVSSKVDDKKYTFSFSLEVDVNKASKDALKEYGIDSLDAEKSGYDDAKKSLEESGFKCK